MPLAHCAYIWFKFKSIQKRGDEMNVKSRYRLISQAQCLVCRMVLFFLFRALRALARLDSRVKTEVSSWPEGRVLGLTIPGGPALYLRRGGDALERLKTCSSPDILILFKSPRDAFYVFTGQMGVAAAYAQHRFCLRGNVSDAMSFVRCVDLAEGYLFPAFWAKRILKAPPQKQIGSLRVYGAVIFGK